MAPLERGALLHIGHLLQATPPFCYVYHILVFLSRIFDLNSEARGLFFNCQIFSKTISEAILSLYRCSTIILYLRYSILTPLPDYVPILIK